MGGSLAARGRVSDAAHGRHIVKLTHDRWVGPSESLARVLALMALEVTLLMTVSIAGWGRLSTVTNGIAALGFYGVGFIGGLVEQIGGLSGIESMRTVGIVTSLISPSDAMWRLAAYYLQPAILRGLSGPLFASATVPSALMIWWALGYTALALAYGVRSFSRRAL